MKSTLPPNTFAHDYLYSKKDVDHWVLDLVHQANAVETIVSDGESLKIALVKRSAKEGSRVIPVCAKLEEEISRLDEKDSKEFLESLGLKESGLDRVIRETFSLLDLITFLTTGEIETRAWTINKGMTAAAAAGKIHTDIEKGFIRAEVVSYDDMVHYNGRVSAREAGKARSEGREYTVKDGDVILFFHN